MQKDSVTLQVTNTTESSTWMEYQQKHKKGLEVNQMNKQSDTHNIFQYLNLTPANMITLNFSNINYLSGYRNKCFPVKFQGFINFISKVEMFRKDKFSMYVSSYNIHNVTILCLPSFFLVGMRKSATDDFVQTLMAHQGIYEG